VGLDPADEGLVTPIEIESVGLGGGEHDLLDRLDTGGQGPGNLGDRLSQPLGVLLGDDDRHTEGTRPSRQRCARPGDRVEAGQPPKRLLHVDDHEGGAVAVEFGGGCAHSATAIAKLRCR
jgi:hypothetical protein